MGTDHGLQAALHRACWVCGEANKGGLGMVYAPAPDGAMAGAFACETRYAGYDGMLHGGVVASLLDGAMTNWLLAHGVQAVTGDLRIRYRKPVKIGVSCQVRGWQRERRGDLCLMRAELIQEGEIHAVAEAKFAAKAIHRLCCPLPSHLPPHWP